MMVIKDNIIIAQFTFVISENHQGRLLRAVSLSTFQCSQLQIWSMHMQKNQNDTVSQQGLRYLS